MNQDQSTLGDYIGVLRRRKSIILGCTLAVALATYGYAALQRTTYQAMAQVAIAEAQTPNPLGGTFGQSSATAAARASETEAVLAHSAPVATGALARVPFARLTPNQLLGMSTVTANPSADVLSFTVKSPKRATAIALANALAAQYIRFNHARVAMVVAPERARLTQEIAALKAAIQRGGPAEAQSNRPQLDRDAQALTQLAAYVSGSGSARVVLPATGGHKTQPQPGRTLALGLAGGLLLGVILAFVRQAFDPRLRSSGELAAALGLPILGRLATPPRALRRASRLAMLDDARPDAEAYRRLATRLLLATRSRSKTTVMVTSATAQEGKSTTTGNLAVALAELGKRVLLVDLDLAQPTVGELFGVRHLVGLAEVLRGEVDLDAAVQRARLPGEPLPAGDGRGRLEILPAGSVPADPMSMLSSRRLRELIDNLRAQRGADIVLLDTAPLLPTSHAIIVSGLADSILVVGRATMLDGGQVAELEEILASLPITKLGLVATGARTENRYGDSRYYRAPAPAAAPDPAIAETAPSAQGGSR